MGCFGDTHLAETGGMGVHRKSLFGSNWVEWVTLVIPFCEDWKKRGCIANHSLAGFEEWGCIANHYLAPIGWDGLHW